MPLKIPRQRAREPETPGSAGRSASTPAPRTSPSGCVPATSPSSTTRTSTRSAPRRCWRAEPAAVVNAAPSISGRYPNLGPEILVDAGIPLLDNVGADVMHTVHEGQQVRLDGDELWSATRSWPRARRSTTRSSRQP